MDNQILFASLGAVVGAIVTSLIAPYVLQSAARREARAEALRKLMEVELTRWASDPHLIYRKNQIELKAAVLVAGGSRLIVDNYSRIAAVARAFSDLEKEDGFFDGEGGIPTDIASSASDAATLLSQSLWYPFVLRFIPRAKLKRLIEQQRDLEASYKDKRGESAWGVRTI